MHLEALDAERPQAGTGRAESVPVQAEAAAAGAGAGLPQPVAPPVPTGAAAAAAAAADPAEVHRDRRVAGPAKRIAVLSDGRGAGLRARRRYHRGPVSHPADRRGIDRDGVLDGRGRQTIRLSGS